MNVSVSDYYYTLNYYSVAIGWMVIVSSWFGLFVYSSFVMFQGILGRKGLVAGVT